jgi:FkbM family methyltransferase
MWFLEEEAILLCWPESKPIEKTLNIREKLLLYLRSIQALKSPNAVGLPIIPKALWPRVPYSRNAYNTFIDWLSRLALGEVRVVLDVGANHGDFSNAASAMYASADIYLFEPLPHLQQDLRQRMTHHARSWHLMPFALGSQPGTFPLYIDEMNDSIGSLTQFSSEYLAANPAARPTREISCEVRRLDDILPELGVPSIDVMKVDVEGFEFEVFEGALSSLAITRALIVEVSLVRRPLREGNPLVKMSELLIGQGFDIVDVIPSLYDPCAHWKPVEFNVLARRATANDSPASKA